MSERGTNGSLEAIVDGSTLEMRNVLRTSGTDGWTTDNDDTFSPSLTAGQWYYFAFAYNGSQLCNFENGAQIGAHTVSGTINSSGNPMGLGASAGGGGDYPGEYSLTNALIDEVRVEHVFRSPNWIWATYVTVTSNNGFNAYGSVQTGSVTNYTITASAGANGTITPSGAVLVQAGNSQTFTIGVNSGYSISNVLMDGSSVGTPSSYTFNNVQTNHTISVFFGGSGPTGFSAWADSMTVSFSDYNRSETLTNFPVLVVLSTNIAGFSYSQFASTSGYDLRFSPSDGSTNLNYEIEQWNPGGNSYVWVQVPQLTSSSYIWAYWGNPSVAGSPSVYAANGAMWPTNAFAGVWHMGQPNTLDSTANGNNGTASGSITNAAGMIGVGQGVVGGYELIAASSSMDFGATGATISGWVRFNALPTGNGTESAITRTANQWALEAIVDGSTLEMRNILKTGGTDGWTANNDDVFSPTPVVGLWYYFAFTYNGSQLCNFENGLQIGAHTVSGTINKSGNPVGLGASGGGNGDVIGQNSFTNAIIDEIRVEQVFRSTNWIWATYMTVASNASFSAYGSVQGGGANIPPSSWIQQYYSGMSATNYANLAASIASNGMTVWGCYLAGLSPTNTIGLSAGIAISNGSILVTYPTGPAVYSNMSRYYEVDSLTNLLDGTWQPVPGATNMLGERRTVTYTNNSPNGRIYYRVRARLQ